MKFSLIICTYQRPEAIVNLLNSVQKQTLYPDEIIVVDGSLNDVTKAEISKNNYQYLSYFKVNEKDRGLTKQRNFGISKVTNTIDIVCFLDDDVILDKNYFKKLIETYTLKPDALGVGGYITNEVEWHKKEGKLKYNEFELDGFVRKLGQRNVVRKRLRLLSNKPSGVMPKFSNGLSIGFLPLSGKIYPVEFFMGGVSSFKKKLLDKIKFSTYFEGYGLYEDLDFCLRASKMGHLYVNTAAKLEHHHEEAGRPDKFSYGKMVVRNGWYVWRVKYISPSIKDRFNWNAIVLLLTFIRFTNIFTTNKPKEAFTESIGRLVGWFSLFFNKPKNKT